MWKCKGETQSMVNFLVHLPQYLWNYVASAVIGILQESEEPALSMIRNGGGEGQLLIGDLWVEYKRESKREQNHFGKKVHYKQSQRWENGRHCTGNKDSDMVRRGKWGGEAGEVGRRIRLTRAFVYHVKELWFNQMSISASQSELRYVYH